MRESDFYEQPCLTLPKTNSSPLKLGFPKRKRESIPTIHFQGLLLLVSGRVTPPSTRLEGDPFRFLGSGYPPRQMVTARALDGNFGAPVGTWMGG